MKEKWRTHIIGLAFASVMLTSAGIIGWLRSNTKRAEQAFSSTPPIVFEKNHIFLGLADPDTDQISGEVFLHNEGPTAVTITEIATSCGCMTVAEQNFQLAAGERKAIPIKISTKGREALVSARLACGYRWNGNPRTEVATISVWAGKRDLLSIRPPLVEIPTDFPLTGTINVEVMGPTAVLKNAHVVPGEHFQAVFPKDINGINDVIPMSQVGVRQINISLSSNGPKTVNVPLFVDGEKASEVQIRRVSTPEVILISPQSVFAGMVKPAQRITGSFFIDGKKDAVRLESDLPEMKITKITEDSRGKTVVEFAYESRPDHVSSTLTQCKIRVWSTENVASSGTFTFSALLSEP